jgi:hypothetical protein
MAAPQRSIDRPVLHVSIAREIRDLVIEVAREEHLPVSRVAERLMRVALEKRRAARDGTPGGATADHERDGRHEESTAAE